MQYDELEKKMSNITETAHDATGLEGVVKIDELPWIDIGVGDNAIKVLRVCPETQQLPGLCAPQGRALHPSEEVLKGVAGSCMGRLTIEPHIVERREVI